MSILDLTLALVVVAAAAAFLVWQLGLRRRPPPCHPTRTHASRGRTGSARHDGGPNVVLDDKLARALERARSKRSGARV